ncbi:MAG TPA: elongation factor P [Candidatus Lambdaproteobacteria bacterium]|nr:elongation factor P [Candidatus Lambdaproteobacteria bacterium]
MYETSDIRKGLRIEMDDAPFVVVDFQFVKPGKGTAFTRTKIRNMITGAVLDRTFKSGEKLKPADTEDREMQFLYSDGDFHFMDNGNYEQVSLESNAVGDASNYLTENMMIGVSFFQGRTIGLTLPNFVVLEVIETAPGEKGNTVTGASKPAVVSTGYTVNVPLFVNEGDQLRIDTRTGEYVERVKN